MGMYVGNAIIAAAERAVKSKAVAAVLASGGARMQVMPSPMQMRTTVAVQMLKEAACPYRRPDPSDDGGVTASYAGVLGDVQIADNAQIGFAGAR